LTGESGFTLIELLMVIAILGVLSAIVVFGVSNLTESSAQSACSTDFRITETAVQTYKAEMRSYPNSKQNGNAALPYTDNGNAADNAAASGGELLVAGDTAPNLGTVTGIGPWLRDAPTNPGHYTISVANDGSGKIAVLGTNGNPTTCSAVN
jgi:general secretion pathway protein G